MSMERISEAILDKVKAEAQEIIKDAEEKARERTERAKGQQATRLEEGRNRLIDEANEEAARILAQSSITSRQELLLAKTRIIDEIISKAKETLASISSDESASLDLIEEAIATLGIDKARVYVSPKDVDAVRKALKGNKKLADRVAEVSEVECSGGVIVEDIEGELRIDNTYDTRLEMLLPRLLPEIGKELFQNL